MKKIDVQKLEYLISKQTNEELFENRIACKEVIVYQEGRCVFSTVFGTDLFTGTAANKGMIYRAASMTKPITSVAVLQLIDKHLLSLDDKVSKFFPKAKDLKVAKVNDNKIVDYLPCEREITIRNLLSHTSGIGCQPVSDILGVTNNTLSLDEAINDILSKPLSFEPDSSQSYSPTEAFDIAAGIVQIVSDCPFDEYLKKNIFAPLKMVNTTFSPTDLQWKNIVAMHNRTNEGKSEISVRPEGCVFENYLPKRMPAGAGLITTAEDYIKFADMLCFKGTTKDKRRILSENAVNLMASSQIPSSIDMGFEKWGLGVRVVTSKDYPWGLGVGCFGWSGAYGSHFWVDMENRISVVMMKNSLFDGGAGHSACQLEKAVYQSLEDMDK